MGGRVGLYELELKGPKIDLKNQFLNLSNPYSTHLGIQICSWVFRLDRVRRVGWVWQVDRQP